MQISSVQFRKKFALLHKEAVKNATLSNQIVFFYKAAWSLRSDCVLAAVSGAGSVMLGRIAVERLRKAENGENSLKTAF